MSGGAAAGGPGAGPGGSFPHSLRGGPLPKQSTVAAAVVGASLLVYGIWELRVRAARRMGKMPKTFNEEWYQAERARNRAMPLEAAPDKAVFLNPHWHNMPADKTIIKLG